MVGHSDFQVNLHPREELASDIKSQGDAILKAEDSRQASETSAFVADKKRILQAGLGELRRIVAEELLQMQPLPLTGNFRVWLCRTKWLLRPVYCLYM